MGVDKGNLPLLVMGVERYLVHTYNKASNSYGVEIK